MTVGSRLVCHGCGCVIEARTPYPFRCPRAGEGDIDHLLERQLSSTADTAVREIFHRTDENPFIRYRELLHAYDAARSAGFDDGAWCELVEELDSAVADVDGRGFRVTPFQEASGLAKALGVDAVWVKDESGNVSGSHKGRHLMGVMLWLEAARRLGLVGGEVPPLAIASCGNAALAAAVVARAAGRRLEVFVPTHANPAVLERLTALGAHLHACPRIPGESGDPCYLRFREALAEGAVPFTCQGNENGLTLDGGKTMAWEMVSSLAAGGDWLDRVFLHVGGGALASSVVQGLREAHGLGVLGHMPTVHAVQTTGAYPLERAYARLTDRMLTGWARATGGSIPAPPAERSLLLASDDLGRSVAEGRGYAVNHRSEFMWPWEEEPHSIADGILDDETYDWFAVVEAMIETGGWPIVVSEETLAEANALVRSATDLKPCYTGTAGLAGAMTLAEVSGLHASESVAVVVSGSER